MAVISLKQAAAWCGGTVAPQFEDRTFQGANNDTRKLQPGELFVALEGVRDGHEFITAAFEKGAAAVLCKRCGEDLPAIVVADPRIALGQIAAGLRRYLGMQVVGVTGSVGKSTTKEMIAAVLQGNYMVSKTPANFNNDLGMPMSILAMPEDTQVAVLEMGMNHFGEIRYLTRIAQPNVAVIINVGTMHIENLGSREGILQAKLEILEGLAEDGKAFFNGDNDLLRTCRIDKDVAYFGTDAGCAVYATDIREGEGSVSFTVNAGDLRFPVILPVEGLHYVADALAAVSVGLAMGVAPEQIACRLEMFRNMEGRQEIFTARNCTIIKDCYNAGPESMAAALAVLGKRSGRRIAVLGDMLELGDHARESHLQVGRIAAANADIVLAYGPNAPLVAQGALEAGIEQSAVIAFAERGAMARKLRALARRGDTLLFKGSHGMHMELVLQQFLREETDTEE